MFSGKFAEVGFIDDFPACDTAFVTVDHCGQIRFPSVHMSGERRTPFRLESAEDRQEGDTVFFRCSDNRIPAGEIPFARLWFDLSPVQISAVETDSRLFHHMEFLLHFRILPAVQMSAGAIGGVSHAGVFCCECGESGGEEQDCCQLFQDFLHYHQFTVFGARFCV